MGWSREPHLRKIESKKFESKTVHKDEQDNWSRKKK